MLFIFKFLFKVLVEFVLIMMFGLKLLINNVVEIVVLIFLMLFWVIIIFLFFKMLV